MAFTFGDFAREYFPTNFGEPVQIVARKHASGHLTEVCPYCDEFLKYVGDRRVGPDDMYCRSCRAQVWWKWNSELRTYESFGCRGAER